MKSISYFLIFLFFSINTIADEGKIFSKEFEDRMSKNTEKREYMECVCILTANRCPWMLKKGNFLQKIKCRMKYEDLR